MRESSAHRSKEQHCTPRAVGDAIPTAGAGVPWGLGGQGFPPVTPHNPQSTEGLGGRAKHTRTRGHWHGVPARGDVRVHWGNWETPPGGRWPCPSLDSKVWSSPRTSCVGQRQWGAGMGFPACTGGFSACGFRVWGAQGEWVRDNRRCIREGVQAGGVQGLGGRMQGTVCRFWGAGSRDWGAQHRVKGGECSSAVHKCRLWGVE